MSTPIDWTRACDDAQDLFVRLLQTDTSNGPGLHPNERAACEHVARDLADDGVTSTLLEGMDGRTNLVARLTGDGTGGAPILLSAHLDVVPADARQWAHPPFAGEIHDGYLWGRGAIDMKNMAAMATTVVRLLKRSALVLRRDVILACVADEEAGCEWGSLWLAKNHPELIRAEYAISEIGGFTQNVGGRRFYPVQVAEKGMAWLTAKVRGTEGHGSLPNKDNPITRLSEAAARLGRRRLPYHRTAVADAMLAELARHQPAAHRLVLSALRVPALAELVLDHIFPDPGLASTFDANLHNTANVTVLRAGAKVNQVPGEATMQIDCRTLPGWDGDTLIRELRELIGDRGIELDVDRAMPPTIGSWDDPIADRIRAVLAVHDPGGIVIPSMIPGFTDAKAWSPLGMKCWGFSPVKLPADLRFARLFHGVDERIPVDGFRWGVRVLYDLIEGLVT